MPQLRGAGSLSRLQGISFFLSTEDIRKIHDGGFWLCEGVVDKNAR